MQSFFLPELLKTKGETFITSKIMENTCAIL